ncbi:MAG: DUF4465 domain-containing protein [Bacteroidales bacterium]
MKQLPNIKHLWALTLVCTAFFACSPNEKDDPEVLPSIADFEDLALKENSNYEGKDSVLLFASEKNQHGGISFQYNYTPYGDGGYSGGITYSNKHDTTTPGHLNKYSVADGNNGNNVFLLMYDNEQKINFLSEEPRTVQSAKLCLNTYAAIAIKEGSQFSEKFTDGDYFCLKVSGVYADEKQKSDTIRIYLADYRNGKTDILTKWTKYTDFSQLGKVKALQFDFDSTEKSEWGISTPKYVCIDEIVYQ